MVDTAISIAVEKLGAFVTEQVKIRIGVKDGIVWLKKELGYLLGSVKNAEAQEESELIRLWTDDVRDVALEAVVILERFSAGQEKHAAAEKGVLNRMRSFVCICKKEANLYDIGKDIESLKEKIIGIKSRRDEYHIDDLIKVNPDVHQRKRALLKAASFDHETDVIGFEDDVRTLLAQLGNEDPSLGLISIHGMGGLGKSTLASKLYHSSELSHFKRRAWVCVSEDYDIKLVLRKIIHLFTEHKEDSLNDMEEVELVRHLRNILLDGDHYLAVIDDIWDVEVWKRIKNAFPDKKNGSRVIITTRYSMVAEDVNETCFVHKLRFLSEDESWKLFSKRARPTSNLERLGKEMVGQCGGLPLAIVILGGLLLQKKTYTFWSDVKDHLWKRLKGKSLEIQEVLNLSFIDLSLRTKHCFLYLARFPEDHIIDVFTLKLLWIAEEFVSEADEEDGGDMEDVAEDIVIELISRNMIQMQEQSVDGQVLKCRVHDLVRDLAIEKATENKILGIFDSCKQHPNPTRLLQGQPRHAIYNGLGEYLKLLKPNPDDSKLRSLALINININITEVEEVKVIYTRFIYLKVLDLSSVSYSEGIPEEIGDLILLKFLGLSGGKPGGSAVIPPSIGKLKKLQTLLGSSSCPYKFPNEICELKELRHLIFSCIDGNLKIGPGQTKLRTISCITYTDWILIDHVNLINLHTLNIYTEDEGEDKKEYSLESIANLTSLRTVSLSLPGDVIPTLKPLSSCKHLKRVSLMGKIKDPAELSFLPDSVTELMLWYTGLTKDPMPTLGTLSNLSVLYLDRDAYEGKKMVCGADGFPCLQYLKLDGLYDLEEFQVDDGALPCLKAFEIDLPDSVEMDKIPQRIRSLPPVPEWGFLH